MLAPIIFFVLLIGVLVLFHEFGHFFAAKKLGVRVDEFAFGFPPRLLSIVRGGTRYAINLLPFGGYVKIFGESGEGEGMRESFISRPISTRFLIIAAGVFMNFLLAWVLFSIGAGIGLPTVVTKENEHIVTHARVGVIFAEENSPAARSGLKFGDAILRVEAESASTAIREPEDLQNFVAAHLEKPIRIYVERGKSEITVTAEPRRNAPEGQGPLGIQLAKMGVIRHPWYTAWWEGLKTLISGTAGIIVGLAGLLRDLFETGKVSADVSGPVGIFMVARDFGALGINYLLQLAALLSINLAILNALPFPALDGGRMLFLAIEKIKGSRVDQQLERAMHAVGFAILILLMLAVTYRDIAKNF